MPDRQLPVRPRLAELEREAAELQRTLRAADPSAALAEARHALARSYGVADWPRLELACLLTDAIFRDDPEAVRGLVERHPFLLIEDARGVPGNWGPPLSYAANLGRDRIVTLLLGLGAQDVQYAFERACLQGRIATARMLHGHGAKPRPGSVLGPCETLDAAGLELLLELGAPPCDEKGSRQAPLALVLQTYARAPEGKHRCLELLAARGLALPDTAVFAVHRGRLDLLAAHHERDPDLLRRTFSHAEIYPPELGCDTDESLALHGTPLAGTTLLHLCVDFDELVLAEWILAHGGDPDARASVDADGFGGHTALFGCVVSQPFRVGARRDDAFARLLLDRGADPNARASLRKRLRFVADESLHEYRDVTPRAFGERFHDQDWVDRAALALVIARGGR